MTQNIAHTNIEDYGCQILQAFFAALVQSANTSFDTLLEALLSTARSASPGGRASKQAFHFTAQCAAVLCLAAGEAMCSKTEHVDHYFKE